MSIVWADFPSGQRGLYGNDKDSMLNGIWADVDGGDEDIYLADDIDPAIGAEGVVLHFRNENGSLPVYVRLTYPAAVDTAGVAFRLWMATYPIGDSNEGNPQWEFRTISQALIARVRIGSSGQFLVYNAAGTLVHTGDPAAVVTNAYNHVETKVVRDAAAGTIEIRVNGAVEVNLNAQALGATDIVNVVVGQIIGQTENSDIYYKDLIFWDGEGSYANDFLGSVSVYDLYADADESLNWTPSVGALGYPLLADVYPAGVLTASGAIADGNVARIDNTYYRFSTAGTVDGGAPAGTLANPWRVSLGASVADALSNFYKAIGATGVAGTDYSTALTAHTTVDANGVTATQVSVTAKLIAAHTIVTTETGANLAWHAGTLTYGPTDPSYISADATPPAAAVFTMTDLPPDVTSIRALLPIFRGMKTDGGDCNVQAGLSPDNATWVNGADEPMTVAFTWYWSPIHTNPDTAAPWTPGEVNNAYVRVNRTL